MSTHGRYTTYVIGRCRCDECRAANRDYMRTLNRATAEHRWNPDRPATPTDLVPADRARSHLQQLLAAGMGPRTIATKSGIAHGSISAILYGKPMRNPAEARPPRRRIRRSLETRILAITPDLADGARVDAAGTTRRLQALVACGWTISALARRLSWNSGNLWSLTTAGRQVTAGTRRAVSALYDELWDTPPPSRTARERLLADRAREMARNRGWFPPLAWDDDQIDNPRARPHIRRKEIACRSSAAILYEVG